MFGPNVLDDDVAEVRSLIEERLRIRGRDLSIQVRKAGRLLPRRIRRDATALAQAAELIQNPKLARMVNVEQMASARARIVEHLKSVDPREIAITRRLNMLALIAIRVLIVVFVLGVILYWQGVI